jgi:hypothetical protein
MGGYQSHFGGSIEQILGGQPMGQQPNVPPMAPAAPAEQAPANASAAPVKAGLRHTLMQVLGNFTYGGSQAMKKAAGLPTDQEIATQNADLAHVNAQTQLAMEQAKQMKDTVPVQLANGTVVHLPSKMATDLFKQQMANQGKVEAAKVNKRFLTTPQGLYDTQTTDANGLPTLLPNSGQGVTITKEIADDYGLPADFVGKQAKITDLAAAQRGQSSQSQIVQGAGGPVAANKVTGTATPLTVNGQKVGNPGVEVAYARAQAAAKYGIAVTDEGDTISKLQALEQGTRLASGNPLLTKGLGAVAPAYEADLRLKQMLTQSKDVSGASDQALLFNHISMTGGNVKGLRLGEHLTEAHRTARSIPEDLAVLWNKAANGEALSPEQRENFVKLAKEVRQTRWQEAAQKGKLYGVNVSQADQDPELEKVDLSAYTPAPKTVAPAGSVLMQSPDGKRRAVPAAQVDHFKSLGAKVVGK